MDALMWTDNILWFPFFYTLWIPDKEETRWGKRELAIHCMPRSGLSDGGLSHMERTNPALSASEPTAALPSWESCEARRLTSFWMPAKQPINAAWSQWKQNSQLLFLVHLPLCKMQHPSWNYLLLFLNFTFYCQHFAGFFSSPYWTKTCALFVFSKWACWWVI